MTAKQISTSQHDNDVATQTVLRVMSRASVSSLNLSVLKAPPWQVVKSVWMPLKAQLWPRNNVTPSNSEWNVFRAEEPLTNVHSDITALTASFLRDWGTWRERDELIFVGIWGDERRGQSHGSRCSSSMWRPLEGHRSGWLEEFVLWLFRLSVDSEDPAEEEARDES